MASRSDVTRRSPRTMTMASIGAGFEWLATQGWCKWAELARKFDKSARQKLHKKTYVRDYKAY